jgi:hypothetical protein
MTKKKRDRQSDSETNDAETGDATPIQRTEIDADSRNGGGPAGANGPGGTREPAGTYDPAGTVERSDLDDTEPVLSGYDRYEQYNIQRALRGTDTSPDDVPETVRDVLAETGDMLDRDLKGEFEDRMDADFSDVRIHTGPAAARAADAIDAKAFTCGTDIVFNSGEYDPESDRGQHLLAHELAHVEQQTGAAISMMPQADAELEIDPDPQLEREADQAASEALDGDDPLVVNRMGTDVHIQRATDEPQPGDDRDSVDSEEELYESLDETEREALEHIKQDQKLWSSWQATISADIIQSEIEASGTDVIETALERYHRNIIQKEHEPIEFMTGEAANEWYLEQNPEAEKPHQPNCIAIEFKPGSKDTLYRVTDSFAPGDFQARKTTLKSKKHREEVLDTFALKEKWSEYNKVATLSLDGKEETPIVVSTAASVTDDSPEVVEERGEGTTREGGIEQYWLTGRLAETKFNHVEQPNDEIETFLEEE